MRNEFCTLFDRNYLARGLVLYRSLERACADFRLRVFCMDAETKTLLDRLALPRLTAIGLDELEARDSDLLAVKPTRTQLEYCWTATPSVCAYSFDVEPGLEQITYLDADVMFFGDPGPIFDELGGGSVLIVPHRYAPQSRHLEETSGVYNVQFVTFRRDERGLEALHWWRDRCIEWCYYRVEDGKLGDQKYLDDWPERFEGVHVLEHVGGGLAPWNVSNYALEARDGRPFVDGVPLVFYHYHSLKLFSGITRLRSAGLLASRYRITRGPVRLVWTADYPISARELELVWEPYLRELGRAAAEVQRNGGDPSAGFVTVAGRTLVRHEAARAAQRLRHPFERAPSRSRR
jgi:hypothetical protein